MAFLDESLQSIFNQTDKRFNVYVGNDNSHEDIDSIIENYLYHPNFHYKKFDNNLGGSSLVKHWERCINMMGDEEWIWLFSDDDMMDENAVECFYNQKRSVNNVYRFNLNIVDKDNNKLDEVGYPESETAVSFLEHRLQYKYINAITNYIFSREIYREKNGFVDFPMAWSSDDASIIQFAESGQILLINDSRISWRNSGTNISTNFDHDIVKKKIAARVQFVKWLFEKKIYLLNDIENHKSKVAQWFYIGIKSDLIKDKVWGKFKSCTKLFPYLGFHIYKLFFVNLKSIWWNRIYTLYKTNF